MEKKNIITRTKAGVLAAIMASSMTTGSLLSGCSKNEESNTRNTQEVVTYVDKDNKTNYFIYDSETKTLRKVGKEDVVADEELTTEKFEDLVANFATTYKNNDINLSLSDITKFVMVANIDKLSQDNKELVQQIVGDQLPEEVLNDAAKVIGATFMYNHTLYNTEHSCDNFILMSEAIFGNNKEKLETIEQDYILKAANITDTEELTKIADKLFDDLNSPTSEISYLDDGIGFAMQADINLLTETLSNSYLHNHEGLNQIATAEKYVSNILTEIRGCNNSNTKTLTK